MGAQTTDDKMYKLARDEISSDDRRFNREQNERDDDIVATTTMRYSHEIGPNWSLYEKQCSGK